MKSQFIAPIVTPFGADGQIDELAMHDILERMLDAGISGIVLLGSIGEFFALTRTQKARLIELTGDQVRGRTQLIAGIGGMDMAETIELAEYARSKGVNSVICISPYYFALCPGDIEGYYDQVISATKSDFYLYNFPARTGYDLTPEITYNLLKRHPSIAGYKDSISGMDHSRALLRRVKAKFPNFQVFSGFDDSFAHMVLSGGAGTIGGLSNIMPEVCMQWVGAMEREDISALASLQRTVDDMMELYHIAPLFVPAIKKAMQLRGMRLTDVCSTPIRPVTQQQAQAIEALLRRNGLL